MQSHIKQTAPRAVCGQRRPLVQVRSRGSGGAYLPRGPSGLLPERSAGSAGHKDHPTAPLPLQVYSPRVCAAAASEPRRASPFCKEASGSSVAATRMEALSLHFRFQLPRVHGPWAPGWGSRAQGSRLQGRRVEAPRGGGGRACRPGSLAGGASGARPAPSGRTRPAPLRPARPLSQGPAGPGHADQRPVSQPAPQLPVLRPFRRPCGSANT